MATFLPDTLGCFPYDPTDGAGANTSANCLDAGYSAATSCGVKPTGPMEYNDPYDPDFQPYKQSYGLSQILVTFNTNKKADCAHAIQGIYFEWCQKKDPSNKYSPCLNKTDVYHTHFGTGRTPQVFDPLHWNIDSYYQDFEELEQLDDIKRFTSPHIAQIDVFQLQDLSPTDLNCWGRIDFEFTDGAVYSYQSPDMQVNKFQVNTIPQQTWTFASTQQVISAIGEYHSVSATLQTLDFMWHDLSVSGCDCAAADLTISGTVTVPHQIAPLTQSTEIFGDLSMLTDNISTGLSIPNFCGKFNFELIYLEENKDPLAFPPSGWPEQLGPCPGYYCDNPIWPEWATPCTAVNCGSSIMSTKIMTVEPTNEWFTVMEELVYGEHAFKIFLTMQQFATDTTPTTYSEVFYLNITYCVAEFNQSPYFVPNPEIFVIGHDYNKEIPIPRFSLTNDLCPYTLDLRAWIPREKLWEDTSLPGWLIFRQNASDPLDAWFEIRHNFDDDHFDLVDNDVEVSVQSFLVYKNGNIDIASEPSNLTISFIKRVDMPNFYFNYNLRPFFPKDTVWEYFVYKNEILEFELEGVDLDEDEFELAIDLRQSRYFGNATQSVLNLTRADFFFAPTNDTPAANYSIYVRLINATDGMTWVQHTIKLVVKEPLPIVAVFDDFGAMDDSILNNPIFSTVFKIDEISRFGEITISFSQALKPPLHEDGYPFFNSTRREFLQIKFAQNYEGPDQTLTYKWLASEWDPEGKYCKFQLTFDDPLSISQGDLPDNIKIYFYRQYFLRAWTPSQDDLKVSDVCDFKCQEAIAATEKAKADAAAAEAARLNPPTNKTASNATASNGTAAAAGKQTPPAAKKQTGSTEARLLAQFYREKERRLKEAVTAADTGRNSTNATSLVNATFQGWSEDYLSNQDLYIILEADMPSMVRNKDELDFMTMLSGFISYILLAAFFLPIMIHFVIQIPTYLVWVISNLTQTISMYRYFRLRWPANVRIFDEAFDDFIQMNRIDSNWLYEVLVAKVIGPEVDRSRVYLAYGLDRYIEAKGTNILKSICVLYLVFPGIFLVLLGCAFYMKFLEPYLPDCIDKPVSYIKNKFQYNALIRVMIETYFPIAMAATVGVVNLQGTNKLDQFTSVLSILLLVYCCYIPIGFYRFLRSFRHTLHLRETKMAFSSLYLSVEYYKIKALPFISYQLFRRMAFVGAAVVLGFSTVMQLSLCIYASLGMAIFILVISPMDSNLQDIIVFANEYLMLQCSILAFLFSDYTYDPTKRYELGEMWVYLILSAVFLNILILSFFVIRRTKHGVEQFFIRRAYNKRRAQLIKEGKIIVQKELTEQEKRILAFKHQQIIKKKMHRKQLRAVIRAKREKQKQIKEESKVVTPVYSDGLQEMRRNFDAIYEKDVAEENKRKAEEWEKIRPKSRELLKDILKDDNLVSARAKVYQRRKKRQERPSFQSINSGSYRSEKQKPASEPVDLTDLSYGREAVADLEVNHPAIRGNAVKGKPGVRQVPSSQGTSNPLKLPPVYGAAMPATGNYEAIFDDDGDSIVSRQKGRSPQRSPTRQKDLQEDESFSIVSRRKGGSPVPSLRLEENIDSISIDSRKKIGKSPGRKAWQEEEDDESFSIVSRKKGAYSDLGSQDDDSVSIVSRKKPGRQASPVRRKDLELNEGESPARGGEYDPNDEDEESFSIVSRKKGNAQARRAQDEQDEDSVSIVSRRKGGVKPARDESIVFSDDSPVVRKRPDSAKQRPKNMSPKAKGRKLSERGSPQVKGRPYEDSGLDFSLEKDQYSPESSEAGMNKKLKGAGKYGLGHQITSPVNKKAGGKPQAAKKSERAIAWEDYGLEEY